MFSDTGYRYKKIWIKFLSIFLKHKGDISPLGYLLHTKGELMGALPFNQKATQENIDNINEIIPIPRDKETLTKV